MKLYAVVDVKAKGVVSIFTSLNDDTAKRSFLMLLTGQESIFTEFPEDFALYSLADIVVEGSNVTVYEPNSEVLRQNGFVGRSITISSAISAGLDYDKRYLRMIRQDRDKLNEDEKNEDVIEEDEK